MKADVFNVMSRSSSVQGTMVEDLNRLLLCSVNTAVDGRIFRKETFKHCRLLRLESGFQSFKVNAFGSCTVSASKVESLKL